MGVHQELLKTDKLSLLIRETMEKFNCQCLDEKNNNNDKQPSIQSTINVTTTTNLQYLIEDCLLNIFSLKSLDVMDLCSLAETCKRFKEITQRVIGNELCVQINCSNYVVKLGSYTHTHQTDSQGDIERIFNNFGSSVSAVTIQMDDACFTGSDALKPKLKDGWKVKCKISNNSSKCFTYKKYSLDLVDVIDDENIPQTLKSFSTFITRYTVLKPLQLHIVERNGRSETVLLHATDDDTITTELKTLRVIDTNLTAATLQSWNSSTESQNLKLILPLRDLRELHFLWCHIPDDFVPFTIMTQLRTLDLKWCEFTDASYVVGIIRRLINLKELTIVRSWLRTSNQFFQLDEETFADIVRTVNGRSHVLTLNCRINFDLKTNFDHNDHRNVKLNIPTTK